jgi:predicted RNase H-like HicB family nuclease
LTPVKLLRVCRVQTLLGDQGDLVADTIEISLRLRCFARKDSARRWTAGCPSLNVYSQGASEEDAQRSLRTAVELWFESCLERGTLQTALRELGFRLAEEPWTGIEDELTLASMAEDEEILGHSFPLSITIPAYQAALLTSPAS